MTTLTLSKADWNRIKEARQEIESHLVELELSFDPELWQAVAGAVWDCLIDAPAIRAARRNFARGVRTVRTPVLPDGGDDDDNFDEQAFDERWKRYAE